MLKIIGTALALGVLSPWLLAMSWRVPFGMLSIKMVLRAAIAPSVGALFIALIVEGCLGAVSTTSNDGTTGAVIGGVIMATVVWLAVRRNRVLRGAMLLAQRLPEAEIRDKAIQGIDEIVAAEHPGDDPEANFQPYTQLVLVLVTPMTQVGLWKRTARYLDTLPPERLTAEQQALRAQALATCRLELDDVAAARRALVGVTRPAKHPAVERWLETTEALVLAVDGDSDGALALIGDVDGEAEPSLMQSQRLVRAHAYAGRGQRDAALALLEMVREEVGDEALHRALHPEGPASDLARQLRGEGHEEVEAQEEDGSPEQTPTLH